MNGAGSDAGGPDTIGLTTRLKLWDAPVRLTHWSFVALLPALWWTGETGKLDLHQKIGLVMLGLVTFRILWGLFGSSTARFASFVKGPGAIFAYAKGLLGGGNATVVGHNPLGGLSVIALLGLLAAQVGFGLFAQDVDGLESGPLSYLISYDGADAARGWHHLLFAAIQAFVVLHICAVLFYRFVKKDKIIGPMITGGKDFPASVAQPALVPAWRIIACAVPAIALAWWISKGAPQAF
jgi:cytochrome b